LRRLLEIAVEREHQGVAGDVRHFLEDTDAAAERVHLDLLPAGLAAQLPIPGLLEIRLANQIAAADVGALVACQLALADLADVAEEVPRHRPLRLQPSPAHPHPPPPNPHPLH